MLFLPRLRLPFFLWAALLSLIPTVVVAVHPHPHAEQDVKDHHRRLREEYPTNGYIHPGLCASSPQGCQQMEQGVKDNARTLQAIGVTRGYVRILVLLLVFEDHQDRPLPPASQYQELFMGTGADPTNPIIPTGSIRDYLDFNSYGNFDIEAEVIDWRVTDNTEAHYSFNISGVTTEWRHAYYPILDALDEDEGFDFSRFDLNHDGKIDSIIVLHSGYGAELGGRDCNNGREHSERIWAHALGNLDNNWISSRTGIQANGYSVSSALRGTCMEQAARLSVITHEYLHTLGLPDLNDGSGEWIGRGLGEYDVMSNAHGRNGAQLHPAFLSPWSKMELGWLVPTEITANGLYQIEASELSDSVFMIREGFPEGEYLLIENRQPILWDELLWGGGLLIWHMDESQDRVRNRGFPGMPEWPSNGAHYSIAVVAADGRYDLETGVNNGDDEDYWREGAVFGPGPVEQEATPAGIYPNTNSYQSGIIQQTGIVIDQISTSNTIMIFRVQGIQTLQPDATLTLMPSPTPVPTTRQPTTPVPTTPLPTPAQSSSPSAGPSVQPSGVLSNIPSTLPSVDPSTGPSNNPSIEPTSVPSSSSSHASSSMPVAPSRARSSATTMASATTLLLLLGFAAACML